MAKNKLNASERLAMLFDDSIYTELDTSDDSGARIAYGSVCGATVFAYVEGGCGGFGASSARKLSKVYDLAAKTGSPVISVFDSEGVRLKEGMDSLKACSEILGQCSRISGVVPQIAVVAGTCGGFESICASLADLIVMEKDAEFFLTSDFVDNAKNGKLDEKTAEKRKNLAAVICDGEENLFASVRKIAGMLPENNLEAAPLNDYEMPDTPCTECIVRATFDKDSLVQLYADKGLSSHVFLGTLNGNTVGVVRVHGTPCRGDTSKIANFVQFCDSFSIPVVTLLDSEGFLQSIKNDVSGGIKNAAILAHTLAEATTPKVTVITGSAIGSVFSVFCGKNAGADMCFAFDNAVISALEPKAAVAVLWPEKIESADQIEKLAADYAKTEASAAKALDEGIVDRIIKPEETRAVLSETLDMLASKRVTNLPKKHGVLPY